MKELLLLVETDDRLKRNILKAALPLHIHAKTVSKEDYKRTLKQILEEAPSSANPAEAYQGEALGEPMVIMCGFSNARMNLLLNAMRKAGAIVPLKAMLTPTNQNWTILQLFDQISKEHAAMTGGGKGPVQ